MCKKGEGTEKIWREERAGGGSIRAKEEETYLASTRSIR